MAIENAQSQITCKSSLQVFLPTRMEVNIVDLGIPWQVGNQYRIELEDDFVKDINGVRSPLVKVDIKTIAMPAESVNFGMRWSDLIPPETYGQPWTDNTKINFISNRNPVSNLRDTIFPYNNSFKLYRQATPVDELVFDFDPDIWRRNLKTITRVGNVIQIDDDFKFGIRSAKFDGTGHLIIDSNVNLEFPFNVDFCIEMWIKKDPGATSFVLYDQTRNDAQVGPKIDYDPTNGLRVFTYGEYVISGFEPILLGEEWTHIALVRYNTTLKLYVNGQQQGNTAVSSASYSNNEIAIGAAYYEPGPGNRFIGLMDELRISRAARYTANFTPPTSEFNNDPDTVLLMHMDGKRGSLNFIDDNDLFQDSRVKVAGYYELQFDVRGLLREDSSYYWIFEAGSARDEYYITNTYQDGRIQDPYTPGYFSQANFSTENANDFPGLICNMFWGLDTIGLRGKLNTIFRTSSSVSSAFNVVAEVESRTDFIAHLTSNIAIQATLTGSMFTKPALSVNSTVNAKGLYLLGNVSADLIAQTKLEQVVELGENNLTPVFTMTPRASARYRPRPALSATATVSKALMGFLKTGSASATVTSSASCSLESIGTTAMVLRYNSSPTLPVRLNLFGTVNAVVDLYNQDGSKDTYTITSPGAYSFTPKSNYGGVVTIKGTVTQFGASPTVAPYGHYGLIGLMRWGDLGIQRIPYFAWGNDVGNGLTPSNSGFTGLGYLDPRGLPSTITDLSYAFVNFVDNSVIPSSQSYPNFNLLPAPPYPYNKKDSTQAQYYGVSEVISQWNTSNVTDMKYCFAALGAATGSASKWAIKLDNWNTANVTNMRGMFMGNDLGSQSIPGVGSFAWRSNITSWNTANVTNMSYMFGGDQINQSSSVIDPVSGVCFSRQTYGFNQNISSWNVSNVTNMEAMFAGGTYNGKSGFNQNISGWNVSKVTNMKAMFASTAFNQPIGAWNTSLVTDMSYMFGYTPFFLPLNPITGFNQNISSWNTSNVTNMKGMFLASANFNQPIGSWDTSKVTDMSYMFYNTGTFNQPIGTWNTANVTTMRSMFESARAFNQPIARNGNQWNTVKVADMDYMIYPYDSGVFDPVLYTTFKCPFVQDISNWCVPLIPTKPTYFTTGYAMQGIMNKDPVWGTCP